ncbi:guanylate-binding protein 1-like isoform X2 [Mercenaria mercenaria]|uniref:guanylate-binding protein 1-like isoform X2 n=1 Tax=Mercenaria mercenaria TaxID=6596 RepID=UPI00234F99F7|nr:guanylate-binding protein 1-like isoform X2 [Mercenaria mercenaria]
MSDEVGDNGELIGIFEKPMNVQNDNDDHDAVVNDTMDLEQSQEEADKTGLSMESMKISEKQMELKAPECGYLEAVEGGAENDQENLSETANIPMESLEIFEKPIELISAKDGNFKIVEDTVRNLEKIESPLNVVAIAGLYRTGKSYLMNRLAGKTNGFILGSSIESTTKGIWAWCKKHPTKKSQVLLLLDTEGLGDVKKGSIDHDNKIFTIVTLLSSTLVYNTMSAFNQDAIEKLTYITMLSKNMKVTSSSSSDERLDCIMPQFVLCLRDFNLELRIDGKEITEDEYLEDCLKTKEVETPEDEKYNRPRECIKKYFTRRKVFTFDRPAGRSVMRRLDTAQDEDLNEEFIQETERFMSYVYDCPEKVLLNKLPVSGSMLAKLLRVYVHAINEGSVPCVEDAMVTMSRLENERHTKNAVEEYKALIKQIQLPVFDKKKLQQSNLEYQEDTLSKLHSKLLFDTDNKMEKATKAEMQTLYEQIDQQNGDLLYENCIAKIHEMHKKIVKTNMKKGKYAVAGGHTIYNSDMHELFEEYNRDLKIIDLAVRQRAQNEFENEMIPESKTIMEEDKMYSGKAMKESVAIKVETIKQDFMKTQEEQHKTFMAELDRQNTRHKNEMENIRKVEREREERKLEKYKEEAAEMRRKVAELEANERLRRQQEAEKQRYKMLARQWAAAEVESTRRSQEKRCILS